MKPEVIASRLKTLREQRQMSREQCATACGVSVSAWQMYENGERIPRDQTKIAIADLFQTPVGDIFFS